MEPTFSLTHEERQRMIREQREREDRLSSLGKENKKLIPFLVPEEGISPRDLIKEGIIEGFREGALRTEMWNLISIGSLELTADRILMRGRYWPEGYQGEEE